MRFTTYDRDNDLWTDTRSSGNCAVHERGGFWYNGCSSAKINGVGFNWYSRETGTLFLKTSRMWLTC